MTSTAFHHCGVTLWRDGGGRLLALPRSFAVSLAELLVESARQDGLEILRAGPMAMKGAWE